MKIHSINHKSTMQKTLPYNIVEENINLLSAARRVLAVDITEDINEIVKYNINGNYSKKWRLNHYGAPSLLSKINSHLSDINLDYFTISSNIADINDYDTIEYAGLQLGEIENSYFSKLLCYNSDISATFSSSNNFMRIFDEIDTQVKEMYQSNLYPKFIICDSFTIIKILIHHPTFKSVSINYKPHLANITVQREPIHIIENNLMGNDIYSNMCLCADMIGPIHIKGGVQSWGNGDNLIFTETIGMAILEERGIKRFIIEK